MNEQQHIIDCDADPSVPGGCKVVEHQKGGQLKFDATQISLYLSAVQKSGDRIEGHKLRNELADKPVLNVNVRDYLLANEHLIPEEWKGKTVFFWGTIYIDSNDCLIVPCMWWGGGEWRWSSDYRWLGGWWRDDRPAALRAS